MENHSIAIEENLAYRENLNGLTELQEISRDFYYDETNNYRKFHLKSGYLNIQDAGEFLLGGIVVDKGGSIDVEQLKKEIKLDKSANELKFKHVAKGSLPEILKSKKIRTILEFLKNQDIDIHFQRVNSFYWGIVDIIDSVDLSSDLITQNFLIKDYLYCVLASEIEKSVTILHSYNYPDIEKSKIRSFYQEISGMVRKFDKGNPHIKNALLHILDTGSNQSEAVFIEGESRLVLVDNYSIFYRDRINTFPFSNHIIDMEREVKNFLDQVPNSLKGVTLENYRFIHSHQSNGIQLSDVVIGLAAKIVNFCTQRTESELISFRKSLTSSECSTLDLFNELITRSDNKSEAYFQSIAPISHIGIYAHLF